MACRATHKFVGRAAERGIRWATRQAMARAVTVLALGISALLASCASNGRHQADSECPVTPVTLRLPSIAPAVGGEPVWMTAGDPGCWCGDRPLKTAWIVDRRNAGSLTVRGESIDDHVAVGFAHGTSTFEVPDADRSTAVPGGADASELEQYAFHVGYVSYPRPGCYELTASFGGRQVRIVTEQARCADCSATAGPARGTP